MAYDKKKWLAKHIKKKNAEKAKKKVAHFQ